MNSEGNGSTEGVPEDERLEGEMTGGQKNPNRPGGR
jgi:hypothetical protein